jgi:hypothetical protein
LRPSSSRQPGPAAVAVAGQALVRRESDVKDLRVVDLPLPGDRPARPVIDVMLSTRRDLPAVRAFFRRALPATRISRLQRAGSPQVWVANHVTAGRVVPAVPKLGRFVVTNVVTDARAPAGTKEHRRAPRLAVDLRDQHSSSSAVTAPDGAWTTFNPRVRGSSPRRPTVLTCMFATVAEWCRIPWWPAWWPPITYGSFCCFAFQEHLFPACPVGPTEGGPFSQGSTSSRRFVADELCGPRRSPSAALAGK